MTDATDFDLEDDSATPPAPTTGQGLRAQLEALKAEKTALLAENKVLKETTRKTNLADLVKAAKIPDHLVPLYPADAEVTADAIQKWGETYGFIAPATAADAAAANPAAAASALISQTTGEAGAPDIGDLLQQLEALRGTPGAAKQARDAGLLKRG